MQKILLVELLPWTPQLPPLSLAYLATNLKEKGFDIQVFDLNIDLYHRVTPQLRKFWDNQDFGIWASGKILTELSNYFDEYVKRIIKFDIQVIGFSINDAGIPFFHELASRIRQEAPERLIILGGHGVDYISNREKYTLGLVDIFVIGYGESILTELIQKEFSADMINPKYFKVWREKADGSRCISNATSIDISQISFPTFKEFDLLRYTDYVNLKKLPLLGTRGCVRRCRFCCDWPVSGEFRFRTAENIVNEIKYHILHNKALCFEFNDLLINGNLKLLETICDQLIIEDIHNGWGGQATIRDDMDPKLLKKLRRAECSGFGFGVESFSNHVLQLMRKGYTKEIALDCLHRCKDAGLECAINLIVGFPGETEDDFKETIETIQKYYYLIDRIGHVSICTLPPGSDIFEHYEQYNIYTPHKDYDPGPDWRTMDGTNTLEIRMQRYGRIKQLISQLPFKNYNFQNLEHNQEFIESRHRFNS